MELSVLDESGIGLVPNIEERAALETELERRRFDEKLERSVYLDRRLTSGGRLPVSVGKLLALYLLVIFYLFNVINCSISYWGRVTGTVADYIIVCGLLPTMDQPERKYYFM